MGSRYRTEAPPELGRALKLLDLPAVFHKPRVTGWEHIPDERPLLFVGNHTLLGMLDIPHLFRALWEEKGIFLNALGDRAHWKIPGWRRLLTRYGAVEGSRETLARLFAERACVLVFPGGAREVNKRKGEEHKLVWKQRLGFAKMAIAHGVTIVPFSAVGVEEALDIVFDAGDLADTPMGRVLERVGLRQDLVPTLVRGIGPTPLPRAERYDFRFGPPVPTARYDGDASDENAWEVRRAVAAIIEGGIADLLAEREARTPAQR